MLKLKLSEQELRIYQKILEFGTKEDVFEIGYAIGRERATMEMLENFNKNNEEK